MDTEMNEVLSDICPSGHSHCGCVIDMSTPATLERDFHAWLQGMSPSPSSTEYSSEYGMEYSNGNMMEMKMEPTDDTENMMELRMNGKVEDGRKMRRKGGTNLYGRPYCPGRPLSMDERTRIIELHMGGMKVNAISKTLCISHGCVSKIISRYRQTGILSPASSPEQRKSRRKKNEGGNNCNLQMNLIHSDLQQHYVIAP